MLLHNFFLAQVLNENSNMKLLFCPSGITIIPLVGYEAILLGLHKITTNSMPLD